MTEYHSFQELIVCGFFNVPQNLYMQGLWDGAYGLSSLSEKTRKSNRLQMSLQRQHFLLSYCLAANNILLMRIRNNAFLLLEIALLWKWEIASLSLTIIRQRLSYYCWTSATQWQKFHTDDAKSVRNTVRRDNWSTEQFHCFRYCLRMTKGLRIKCKRLSLKQGTGNRRMGMGNGKRETGNL